MNIDLSKLISNDSDAPAPLNLKKYINYLKKRKYWIFIIAIFFSIVVGIIMPVYQEKTKTYTTSSVIRFDDPRLSRGISAVTDFSAGMETVSKASLFKSSSFIESVVDSLNLNLIVVTADVKRTRLFEKIRIDSTALYGRYTLKIQIPNCKVYYENFETEKFSLIKEYNNITGNGFTLKENGLELHIKTSELQKYDKIEFDLIPVLKAASSVKEDTKLNYDLDRTRTLMTISYEHSDPEFAPYVTNKVTDMFIQKLLEYKRFQTRSILETLDEQLRVAQKELSESEAELRRFREENPNVFLTQGRETLVNTLANNQTQLQSIKNIQHSIDQMQTKWQNSNSMESKHFVCLEIISFLENQNVAGAALLSERYQDLISERDRLKNEQFNDDHPFVQNNTNQIIQTQNEIADRLTEFQNQLSNDIQISRRNISNSQMTLRSLPRNELKLAELQRNRQIKENILSNIMVRYNEAKVTDAAVIPDAYIVDRATIPIVEQSGMFEIIKFSGVGFILGIFIGIIILVIFVFFDNKIWSSQEVQDKIKLSILAMIPVIDDENLNSGFKNNDTIDPKLVTGDYAPTLAGETFRKLRTRIDMQLGNDNKSLIVGSLFPNEGKSLIAANLAIAFAQQKKKTILIDCDLRRGVQHSTFAKNKVPGFTDMIIKKGNINTKNITDYIQNTHIPNLFLITSGQPIPNPSESLGTPQMEITFSLLTSRFDRIIFDSPPFGLSPDLMVMAKFTKNIILVLKSGATNLSHFKTAFDELGKVRENIIGLVINGSDEVIKNNKYKYSYYQY